MLAASDPEEDDAASVWSCASEPMSEQMSVTSDSGSHWSDNEPDADPTIKRNNTGAEANVIDLEDDDCVLLLPTASEADVIPARREILDLH